MTHELTPSDQIDPTLTGGLSIDQISEQAIGNYGYAIERPTGYIVERLQQADPRIDVIHGQDIIDGHSVIQDYGAPGLSPESWYGLYIENAIADRLDRDFAGEEILPIRAAQASLDGKVVHGRFEVEDIRNVLAMGDIRHRDSVNLAGYGPGEEAKSMRIPGRVMQYAAITDFFRAVELGGTEDTKRVFPVLFAYDQSMLRPGNVGMYDWQLPDSAEDRAKVIRKAYILDAAVMNS